MTTKLSKNFMENTYNSYIGNQYQSGMAQSKYNNSMYGSGDLPISNSGMQYLFKERSGRLKWKDIMKMDLEGMIRSNDLSPLENYLENLIFSSIDENDLQIVPESSMLKLVKIYQYVMEYLLYTQQRLENENKILESNYSQLVNDAENKEVVLKENKSLINTLKKDKKEKEMVLNTYKCLIDEYKSGRFGNKEELKKSKVYHYCKICEGKKFSTEEYLDAHMRRRHYNLQSSQESFKKESSNWETKLDQMKTYFETYVKNIHNESYMKIYENQKNLENKISEVKFDKNHEMREMENNFKSTLIEMKEMYLRNTNMNNFGNSYVGNERLNNKSERKAENEESDQLINELRKKTLMMNSKLEQISDEQSEKIQSIMDQFSQFKNSLFDEFKDMKERERLREMEKEKKKKEKSKKEDKEGEEKKKEKKSEKKDKKKDKEKEEIKTVNFIRDSTAKNSIIKTKGHFNAGPLESDHDSENEVILKNQSINMNHPDVKFSFAANKSFQNSINKEVVLTLEQPKEGKNEIKNSLVENLNKEIADLPVEKPVEKPIEKILTPKNKEKIEVEVVQNMENKEDIVRISQKLDAEPTKSGAKKNVEENVDNEELEKFYHSFVDRDQKFIKKSNLENYTKIIIPENKLKPDEMKNEKLKELLDATAKKNSKKNNMTFEKIQENSKEDILDVIDSMMKNIEKISETRDFFEVYYDTISKTVGLDDCLKFIKNKKINDNVYPDKQNSTTQKAPFSTYVKTNIIDKDDFSMPTTSPIKENQLNKKDTFGINYKVDKEIIPKQVNIEHDDKVIIEDDDQFNHDI